MKLKIRTFSELYLVTVSELLHMFNPIDLVDTGRSYSSSNSSSETDEADSIAPPSHSDVSEDDQEYRKLGHYESLDDDDQTGKLWWIIICFSTYL